MNHSRTVRWAAIASGIIGLAASVLPARQLVRHGQ
jgi:hypothetical protein